MRWYDGFSNLINIICNISNLEKRIIKTVSWVKISTCLGNNNCSFKIEIGLGHHVDLTDV